MSKYKPLSLIILILLLASCIDSNVRFVTPQPASLSSLEIIPEKFKGVFVINNDTIIVTDYTINGEQINSDSLIVKGWGDYLFVNKLDVLAGLDTAFYSLTCAKVINIWNNEKIILKQFDIDFLSEEIMNEFIVNTDTAGLSATDAEFELLYITYIKDNQSQFLADLGLSFLDDNVKGFTENYDLILDNINMNEFQSLLNISNEKNIVRIQ